MTINPPSRTRTLIVVGITSCLFAFIYWHYGLGLTLAISLAYASLLLVIFLIDLKSHLILDKVVYPSMVLALAFSFLSGLGIVSALGGGAIGLVVMALLFIVSRGGMGMGDVKLGVLVGLMVGYPLVIVALFLSMITGGLAGAILLTFNIKKHNDSIPFAPFLTTSAMVALLWGQVILGWCM